MTTRVFLPPEPSPGLSLPETQAVVAAAQAPHDTGRRSAARVVTPAEHRVFSVGLGATIGCAVGVVTRDLLAVSGLATALAPAQLGFTAAAFGLSLCQLMSRLMERARRRTRKVEVEESSCEVPLRRREEVVERALVYLGGLLLGFGLALGAGWWLLREAVPALRFVALRPTPDLVAVAAAAGASVGALAFGDWAVRMIRKQGCDESAPWLLVPAMLAMGLALGRAL